MHTIEVKGVTYQVPSKVSELTPRQFLNIAVLLVSEPTPRNKAWLAFNLMPIELSKALAGATLAQKYDVFNTVASIVDTTEYACPLQSFQLHRTRYFVPAIQRLTSIEFVKAEEYAMKYRQEIELAHKEKRGTRPHYLNLLVATLCRPRKWWLLIGTWPTLWADDWDGDMRQKFNDQQVKQRAELFAQLPFNLRLAIFWLFNQHHFAIARMYPECFGAAAPGAKAGPLKHMIFGLSGHALGNYIDVCHTPILTSLEYYKKLKAEHERTESIL